MVALAVLVFLTRSFILEGARMVKRREQAEQGLASLDGDVVDAIFTFAAPGVANPAIVNQRTHNGCFNGLRMYLSQEMRAFGRRHGKYIDPVPVAGNFGSPPFWHSKMPARDVDTRNVSLYETMECTAVNVTEMPPNYEGVLNSNMHKAARHLEAVMKSGNRSWKDFAVFGLVASYMDDVAEVAEIARGLGWKLVGTSADPSTGFLHGPQVSHLFQKPETLECAITFEGTDSDNGQADWDANEDDVPEDFCGLVDTVGSYVHRGFANRARSMGLSAGWNSTIQANLPACSKVSVMGHSAGGAVAELVGACLSAVLAPGDFGYGDRSLFGWVPATPVELPEVDSST